MVSVNIMEFLNFQNQCNATSFRNCASFLNWLLLNVCVFFFFLKKSYDDDHFLTITMMI